MTADGRYPRSNRRALRAVQLCVPLARPTSVPVWPMGGFRCAPNFPRWGLSFAEAALANDGFPAGAQPRDFRRRSSDLWSAASPCRKSRASEIRPLAEPAEGWLHVNAIQFADVIQ